MKKCGLRFFTSWENCRSILWPKISSFPVKQKSRGVRAYFQETPTVFRSLWLSAYPKRALSLDLGFYALEEKKWDFCCCCCCCYKTHWYEVKPNNTSWEILNTSQRKAWRGQYCSPFLTSVIPLISETLLTWGRLAGSGLYLHTVAPLKGKGCHLQSWSCFTSYLYLWFTGRP